MLTEEPELTCPALNCVFPEPVMCCPERPVCSVQRVGPLLDCIFDADPDVEAETVAANIFIDVETCDGVSTSIIGTLDEEGQLEPYELQGELANPDKTLFEVEPVCPDIEYQPVQIQRKLTLLDNSLWDNAPSIHVGSGNFPTTTINVEFSDGTNADFVWPGGTGFFPAFRNWLSDQQPGCVVANVCANWVGCETDLPWGLTDGEEGDVTRDCLFARGWSFMCCVDGKCVTKATVIESEGAGWVGASKEACSFDGPKETVLLGFVAGKSVYADCSGTPIEIPASCCPYLDGGLDLELFKEICTNGIEGANYDGAIQITIGMPSNTDFYEVVNSATNEVLLSGDGYEEFTANALAEGYVDFTDGPTNEAHYLCPCPPGSDEPGDYFIRVNGESSLKPGCTPRTELANFPVKEIVETCFLRTIGKNDNRRDELLQNLCDKLSCEDTCPIVISGNLFDVDTNAPLNLPLTAQNGFINVAQALTVTDPTGCLAANPEAEISVQITFDHEAGFFDLHRGFLLATDTGLFTAESASNTLGAGGIGTQGIGIGYDFGEAGNQRNDRWVKLTATAGEWLNGVGLTWLGFGAVNENTYDTVFSQDLEICAGLEICDGC